MPRPAA